MMQNLVTLGDAAFIGGVSIEQMRAAIVDADVLPVARLLVPDGLAALYTVTACTTALATRAEKITKARRIGLGSSGSGVAG